MQVLLNVKEDGTIDGVSLWHPINGEWKHIAQKFKDNGDIIYFTDGIQQTVLPEPSEHMLNIIEEVRRNQDESGRVGNSSEHDDSCSEN